jgi:hypothetical protein
VRLTCACLTVGQDGRIVALEDGLDGGLGSAIVNLVLVALLFINVVKAVALPDAEVRVLLNIARSLSLINLLAQVLHDRHTAPIR